MKECRITKKKISALELYPIMAAVGTWGEGWRNRSICFYTDNLDLVAIINKRSTREVHTMELIRTLVLLCLTFNVNFVARHIPGRVNTLADKLSRCQVQGIGGVGRPNSNSSTAPPLACRLEQSVETLLKASLTPAWLNETITVYFTYFMVLDS